MAQSKPIYVRKARKDQGSCGKCGTPIKRGDSYIWWQFRFPDRRMYRCDNPDCRPTPVDLEGNTKRRSHMQATIALDRYIETGDRTALDEAIQHIENVIDELSETIDGMSGTGLETTARFEAYCDTLGELTEWVERAEAYAANPSHPQLFDEPVPDLAF